VFSIKILNLKGYFGIMEKSIFCGKIIQQRNLLVDKLEKIGHLERQPNPNNRRVSFDMLTKEGRAFIRRFFPNTFQPFLQIYHLSPMMKKNS